MRLAGYEHTLVEIAINGRFQGRRVRGVDRYASEITARLRGRARVIRPRRPTNGVSGHLWEQCVLPRLLHKGEVLWSPANSGPLAASRQVVTIHDASVLEHPEWFSPGFARWYGFMLPRLARRASRVLTVSEYSRRALVQTVGLRPEAILVVPNGVDTSFFKPSDAAAVRCKFHLHNPYVLFVGSIEPRKNLKRLIQAWKLLRDLQPADMVIAGSHAEAFAAAAPDLTADGVRYLGYVADSDLPGLYSGAVAFIIPSLEEGFGLPVLEAMACGTPVLSSNGGALPEVTGGASAEFDPYAVEDIACAMRTVLSDEGIRKELRRKGLRRAGELSWDRSAQLVQEVLSSCG